MTEMDFGDWTGRTFAELERLPGWQRFNAERATTGAPGGETAVALQHRVVRTLERLHARHPGETILVVSHLDVIRSAILYCTSQSLDLIHQVEVAPGAVAAIELGARWAILALDGRGREHAHELTTSSE